jgi:hypothetical protein
VKSEAWTAGAFRRRSPFSAGLGSRRDAGSDARFLYGESRDPVVDRPALPLKSPANARRWQKFSHARFFPRR